MTNESAEYLDYGHRDVGLVDGNISFKVRYYLVQIQSHIGRGFSLMRLFIKRIRGL
jgi:hypothetical protein